MKALGKTSGHDTALVQNSSSQGRELFVFGGSTAPESDKDNFSTQMKSISVEENGQLKDSPQTLKTTPIRSINLQKSSSSEKRKYHSPKWTADTDKVCKSALSNLAITPSSTSAKKKRFTTTPAPILDLLKY